MSSKTLPHNLLMVERSKPPKLRPYYPMEKMEEGKRGIALLLCYSQFKKPEKGKHLKPLKGYEKDVERLEKIFKKLNFKVDKQVNPDMIKTKERINHYASIDHKDRDAFVVCVMSHGMKGEFLTHCSERYDIQALVEKFKRTKGLVGKPKMFFLQMCRGDEQDEGIASGLDGGSSSSVVEDDQLYKIPLMADFLLAYATAEDHASVVHDSEGSWFMQALCDALERYTADEGCSESLTDLLLDVCYKVGYYKTVEGFTWEGSDSDEKNPDENLLMSIGFIKQAPWIASSLTSRVCFSAVAPAGTSIMQGPDAGSPAAAASDPDAAGATVRTEDEEDREEEPDLPKKEKMKMSHDPPSS